MRYVALASASVVAFLIAHKHFPILVEEQKLPMYLPPRLRPDDPSTWSNEED